MEGPSEIVRLGGLGRQLVTHGQLSEMVAGARSGRSISYAPFRGRLPGRTLHLHSALHRPRVAQMLPSAKTMP